MRPSQTEQGVFNGLPPMVDTTMHVQTACITSVVSSIIHHKLQYTGSLSPFNAPQLSSKAPHYDLLIKNAVLYFNDMTLASCLTLQPPK